MQKCTTQNCPGSLSVNSPQLHKTKSGQTKNKKKTNHQTESWLEKSPCKNYAHINPLRLKWCSCTVLYNVVELLSGLPCMTHGESWTKLCIRERDAAHTEQCLELFPPYCFHLQVKTHLFTFGIAAILLAQSLRLFLYVSNGEAFQFVNTVI